MNHTRTAEFLFSIKFLATYEEGTREREREREDDNDDDEKGEEEAVERSVRSYEPVNS